MNYFITIRKGHRGGRQEWIARLITEMRRPEIQEGEVKKRSFQNRG